MSENVEQKQLTPGNSHASGGAEAYFEGETEMPATPPTQDEKNLAMIAHLGGIFLGWVLPLILYLVKKDDSRFVADQAKEALNFQITMWIATLVAAISVFLLIGIVAVPLVMIYNVIGCILAGLAANKGKLFRYRYVWRVVK